MQIVKKVRAEFIELYSRVVDVVSNDDNIYRNGENNLYPYEIERNTDMSPTASSAINVMANYISGKGVENDREVNAKKGYQLSDVVDIVAEDVARQSGCFIWVGYGVNEEGDIFRKTLDVNEYTHCRISKEDDNEYPGKIYVKDYAKKQSIFKIKGKATDKKWYYPYNPNPAIVLAQMKADAGDLSHISDPIERLQEMVKSYRGQVYYLNMTPRFKYALSRFDPVYNDANSEYQFSLYTNTQFREGFLGKTAVIMQGLDEEDVKEEKKNVQSWLGAEGTGGVYFLSVEQIENLDNVLKVIQIQPQFDDKLFVEADKRTVRNILAAANNLPKALIYDSDGALFGVSGETYREMKLFYQEQTQKERRAIEKTLTKLGFPTKIIPIIEEKDANTDNTE